MIGPSGDPGVNVCGGGYHNVPNVNCTHSYDWVSEHSQSFKSFALLNHQGTAVGHQGTAG